MHPTTPLGRKEFIALMAVLMSLVAMAIDAILPALGEISSSLNVEDPNQTQLVVAMIFFGMSPGLLLYGPLSDSFGRKKTVYLGLSIFLIGSLVSMAAQTMEVMLWGRLMQGFGAACCRVITMAMIRDKYSGRDMGQIMSLVMIIFILVPALAPSLGQAVLALTHWRVIFGAFVILGLAALIWFAVRQPETLPTNKRRPFSLASISSAIKETLTTTTSRNYTLAAGTAFGAFIGYLSSSQQILQVQYNTGELFPIYFGSLAIAIGLSSLLNSKLVMKFPMENICLVSLIIILTSSSLFLVYAFYTNGAPPLWILLIFLAWSFFFFGTLLGNFNTLALDPLGHIAGVANSVISSLQTLVSVSIGSIIGQSYDGTVYPLAIGFVFCSLGSLILIIWTRKIVSKSR